jgi:hypothetical protein
VRLKPSIADDDDNVATILQTLDDDGIEGGLLLDRRLNDFRFWNAHDVEPA